MTDTRIAGFDGLRAVAALMVFAHHAWFELHQRINVGSHGVWLFFVLSGFLIVRILHRQRLAIERGEAGFGQMLLAFAIRRARRLFPVYYLTLGAFAALALVRPVPGFSGGWWPWHWSWTTNLAVVRTGEWPGAFAHLWSLAVEQQFYLAAGLLLLLLPSSRHMAALALAVLLAIAWKLHLTLALDAGIVAVYADPLVNGAMIAWGGILGLMAGRPGFARWKRAAPAGLLLFLMPLLYDQLRTAAGLSAGEVFMAAQILSPLLAGLLLLQIAGAPQTRLVRLLEARPLVRLGTVSYGFYVYHHFLLHLAHRLPEPFPGFQTAASFAASLAVSWASWVLLERPLLAGRPGAWRQRPAGAVA
ncbi:acyltransferase [Geminicoccaceae bacterium 1502E]|nr:acyltransferase [Geminicoccaceae bacterium 1502E]